MLSAIRKVQKSILVVVTVIICVAFAYFYAKDDAGVAPGANVPGVAVTIDGTPVPGSEAYRLANLFHVAFRDLGIEPPFNMQPLGSFALKLAGEGGAMAMFGQNIDRSDFVINLLILRAAAKDLGIAATEDQVQKAIEAISLFRNASGGFDPAAYQNYVRNGLGRFALHEFEFRELIADFVAYEQIRQLVAAGQAPTAQEVSDAYREQYEEFVAAEVFLPSDRLAGDVQVTEEQIKAQYEQDKSGLLTEQKRAVRYLEFPVPPKGENEAEDQWQARRNEVANRFREAFRIFRAAMEEQGKTLPQAVESLLSTEGYRDLKVQETAPFPASAPPAEFSGDTALAERVFLLDEKDANAYDMVASSTAIRIFWLKEPPVAPVPLTLEEARPRLTEKLKAQESEARIRKSADETRAKLAEALGKGQSILEAAKACGVEATVLKPFSRDRVPDDSPRGSQIRSAALGLVPGELSETQVQEGGALLVYLWSRQVPPRETEPEDRKRLEDSLRDAAASQAFNAWFDARRAAAQVKRPLLKGEPGSTGDIPMSIEHFAPRR
jgi:parvulin-like peptidyl-prolyl isomerase